MNMVAATASTSNVVDPKEVRFRVPESNKNDIEQQQDEEERRQRRDREETMEVWKMSIGAQMNAVIAAISTLGLVLIGAGLTAIIHIASMNLLHMDGRGSPDIDTFVNIGAAGVGAGR